MSRFTLPLITVALLGLGFAIASQATAGSQDRKAMCYPKSVVLSAGEDATNFAAGTTIFMNRMIDEGRNNFEVIEHGDVEIICAWP